MKIMDSVEQPPYQKPDLETARAAKCLAFRLSDMRKPRSFHWKNPPWWAISEKVKVALDIKVSCFKIFIHQGPPIFPPTLFRIHGKKKKTSSIKGCVGIQPANLPWTQADSSAISNLRLLGGQWVKESTVKCPCTPLDVASRNLVQQNKSKHFPKWQILGGIPTSLEMHYTPLSFQKSSSKSSNFPRLRRTRTRAVPEYWEWHPAKCRSETQRYWKIVWS